jgi:type VI secretion system protein ImpL
LRGGGPTPDYTYEALKAYLMLDSREHYDPAAIMAFVREDWTLALQRSASAEQRSALDAHLDALFAERPTPLPIPLDSAVIEAARREVRALPLDERIYGRIKRSFAADIPGFNVREAAGGPAAELVFVRKSGKPLGEPLPGLYTKAAYTQVFQGESEALTNDLAAEAWILGEDQTVDAAGREQLAAQGRGRYLAVFADAYTETLLDVTLAPFGTPEEASRLFNLLSRPEDSPLLKLLQAVSRETALDAPDGEQGALARAGGRVAQVQERLQRILGTSGGAPQSLTDMLVRNAVEERFRALNALVRPAADGAPRPVDHLLGLLGELYQYLSVVASEAAGGAIPPHVQAEGQRVLQQLRLEAEAQPDLLVGDLLGAAVGRTTALTTGGLRAYLNDLWQSGPLTVCRQAIAGRYPIDRSSAQAIQLDDFGQFFGYGGTIDNFFNSNLREYVDSTSSPWRARRTGNVPIQLSAAALQAFENADAIKRAFFRQGSMQPSVAFDLRPYDMPGTLSRFLLDLEGTVVTYEFGPLVTTPMQWPGPNAGAGARLEFRDRASGATAMDRSTGPWGWFQLLDRADVKPGDTAEQFRVTFSNGAHDVIYDLTARSAFNPFALPQLQRFQCPASL